MKKKTMSMNGPYCILINEPISVNWTDNEHKYMSYVNLCIFLYYAADLMFKTTHFHFCYMNAIQNSILYY